MDEFEQRLKQDAADIDAVITPEWQARLRASLHATERVRRQRAATATARRRLVAPLLAGFAAAAIVIAVVVRQAPNGPPAPSVPPVVAFADPPFAVQAFSIETAALTSPLEQEFDRLLADLEKARSDLREDLGFTF